MSDDIANGKVMATILVVDDEPLLAMCAVDMLESFGHKAIETSSAQHALAILKSVQPIDLLMTDHVMPDMPGLKLAKLARDLRPELPVLLVTGYGELGHGEGAGVCQLSKPYHQDDLQAVLALLLDR